MKNCKFSAKMIGGSLPVRQAGASGGKMANFKIVLLLSLSAAINAAAQEEYCVQIWAQTKIEMVVGHPSSGYYTEQPLNGTGSSYKIETASSYKEDLSLISARAARYGKPLNLSALGRWVQVGRGLSREEASALSQKLHQEEGLEAWVVSLSAQEESRPQYSSQGALTQEGLARERLASVLGDALSLFGTPYRFGGNSIEEGLDCSAFVQLIFEAVGVEVPRNARSQYKIGEKVEKSDLQTGDLVFFKNTYRRGISHVGVYMGGGEFIHASAGRSRKVTISSLSEPYYIRKYAGARRLL